MAETILTPGTDTTSDEDLTSTLDSNYLLKDNFLSEFETDSEKSVARHNLGVLASEDVYTKEEVESVIIDKIKKKLSEYIDSSDYITKNDVLDLLEDLVKIDGTTPFTSPQAGVTPVSSNDLTTKRYVDGLLQNYLKTSEKSSILEQVTNILKDYVELNDVYTKSEVYTKDQIDNQNTKFVKLDGTTPFEKPQSGRTPQISSHLTTKAYVDSLLETHKTDIDPHGFTEKLNNKLKKYALKDNVYDRTQTYSRGQIDSVIDKLVNSSVKEALLTHTELDDPHGIIDKVKEIGYVLKDGSIPFKAPQKGVDAVDAQDLITLHQVDEKIEETINNLKPIWITSGAVETTVGFVEDNSIIPTTMTFQEIMDAIFYGKSISIDVPEYITITEKCPVTLCVHGSTGLIEYAELYQNGELIYTLTKDDFENGCVTVDSLPIYEDTEFTFKVIYTNGTVYEETATVKCSMPVFVGLLPKWKFGNTITMDYLIELENEDLEGTQNRFINGSDVMKSFTFTYKFEDPKLRHPFIVLPASYPDLDTMVTKSQSFGIEAFEVIDMIPLQISGVEKDIIYKMYIYKQALSSLNQSVTFNFISEE